MSFLPFLIEQFQETGISTELIQYVISPYLQIRPLYFQELNELCIQDAFGRSFVWNQFGFLSVNCPTFSKIKLEDYIPQYRKHNYPPLPHENYIHTTWLNKNVYYDDRIVLQISQQKKAKLKNVQRK